MSAGPWAERPEQQRPVIRPHSYVAPDGRVGHVFIKIDGEWRCKICEPEVQMAVQTAS